MGLKLRLRFDSVIAAARSAFAAPNRAGEAKPMREVAGEIAAQARENASRLAAQRKADKRRVEPAREPYRETA